MNIVECSMSKSKILKEFDFDTKCRRCGSTEGIIKNVYYGPNISKRKYCKKCGLWRG